MEAQLAIAKRPSYNPSCNIGKPQKVQLLANYYKFKFTNPEKKNVFKYAVKFTPDIPDNSRKIRSKVFNGIREELKPHLNFFIFLGNTCIYSLENQPEIPQMKSEYDGQTYTIDITWVQSISEMDNDMLVFYKVFFNALLKRIKFKQIGRNFFNPAQSHKIGHHNIEVWPGFASSLQMVQKGVLLNVDIVHKVLRTDNVLDFMADIRNRSRSGDPQNEISKALIGSTILTSYNKRTYKVDDIDFSLSPKDSFVIDAVNEGEEAKSTTYHEYFKTKYDAEVKELNQPMLVSINQRTGNKILLVPSLCQMTGLTDSMRANFQLMKDMAQVTHADANRRVQECKSLLQMFEKNEKCIEAMQEWQMNIDHEPQACSGTKYAAGNMVMGKQGDGNRIQFELENCPDIDRRIQQTMYEQPMLKQWGIFYCEQDKRVAVQFMETMQKCCEQFRYPVSKPREFGIRSNRFPEWQAALKANLNPGVQAVVLILPGAKGKAPLYDDLKRLLLKEIPVPSQVVLVNTISRGKNVRSICNKILIQICAKVGGEPWAVDELPYFDAPTMVCGIDVFHKVGGGQKSVLAFCGSVNHRATRFWSAARVQDEGQELSNGLESVMEEGLIEFKNKNGVFPRHVIIYRDGVGESQRKAILMNELPQIQSAIKKVSSEDEIKVMIVLVNKRVNQRFFKGDNRQRLGNPTPGTVVDSDIVSADAYDFFLISQTSRQGVVSPTHYVVVYDSIQKDANLIQLLTYKLCFTYYNVSGSIKVPAPVQYAHRLANLIGERAKGPQTDAVPIPHEHFGKNIKSLYFI